MSVLESFSYCPRCSNPFKTKKSYLTCSHCGLNYYANPKPCTSLVLTNQRGEYLLVKRASAPKKGWWDLPGGFVEDNENFEMGARREAKEEIGVELGDLKYLGSFHDVYEFQNVNYTTLAVTFTGQVSNELVLTPDDDVASTKFFKLQDIPMDRLAFDSILDIFENIKSSQPKD